ncbi:hypothetical protein ABPG72_014726 [Tetrahymena utriculariae]
MYFFVAQQIFDGIFNIIQYIKNNVIVSADNQLNIKEFLNQNLKALEIKKDEQNFIKKPTFSDKTISTFEQGNSNHQVKVNRFPSQEKDHSFEVFLQINTDDEVQVWSKLKGDGSLGGDNIHTLVDRVEQQISFYEDR